jgi:acetylornithine deacetylase/succinyl-diaminopimelate desuccinylase-like protein
MTVQDVRPGALSTEQLAWRSAALAEIRPADLRQLVAAMVEIPSVTGDERGLAEFIVARLGARGLEAKYQPIDDRQGNATARYRGDGNGADLMLYAPIDTHITGSASEDYEGLGSETRPDMLPIAVHGEDYVMGLCAENPKGYAACVIAAAEAVRAAGVPLRGDLLVGLGGGGMPTNKPPTDALRRYNAGQGNGCSFMLEQGFIPDYAIIAKAGWAVAYEEVGLCWFRIRVSGGLGYAGQRHRMAFKNAILEATKVIAGLEEWFPTYSARNESGLCTPQGHVGAIVGGWPHKPAFSPAECEVYVDLRIAPRTSPLDARRQFDAALETIRAQYPGIEFSSELIVAVPGTSTSPDNWIIRSGIAAWESVAGEPHQWRTRTSGATDANILRGRGIPTARIGMPPPRRGLPYEDTFSMGVVEIEGMVQLTRVLVSAAIDTCTRTRDEIERSATGKSRS